MNQTGGVSCNDPIAVGRYEPLTLPGGLGSILYGCYHGMSEAQADACDEVLDTLGFPFRVDRRHLRGSEEAQRFVAYPDGRRGAATWENRHCEGALSGRGVAS